MATLRLDRRGALLYLQRARGVSVDELDRALNETRARGAVRDGGDIRELESAAAAGHADARMALAVYTYRIAGAVSAMAASLGGLDAVAFGRSRRAFRGRASSRVRTPRLLGVELDDDLNQGVRSMPTCQPRRRPFACWRSSPRERSSSSLARCEGASWRGRDVHEIA